MNRWLLIAASFALPYLVYGQEKLIKTVPIKGKVTFAGVDRPGDLYLVMDDGWVRKYDKDGTEIASKKFSTTPTLFDPRDGTLSFAYFRNGQRLEYLSPDMSESTERQLNPEFTIKSWLVCPSKNEIWILDSVDFSLKQTAGRAVSIAYEVRWQGTQPTSATSLGYMREYQNFLFVLDKELGIYMFNNLGKRIRQIEEKNLPWFSFLGEELYYKKDQTLHFMDLYTGETRDIPVPRPCLFALVTDERMILITDNRMELLEFRPR